MINFLLKLRYNLFKKYITPVKFDNPHQLTKYTISDKDEYGESTVFIKDNVRVINNKILLYNTLENREFENWWGKKFKKWGSGCIKYNHRAAYGTWEVKCKLPKNSWPAIWLLRDRHPSEETKISLGLCSCKNNIIYYNVKPERINKNWYVWINNKPEAFIQDYTENTIIIDKEISDFDNKEVFISVDHITPEIDIIEVIKGKLQQTIHYGYSIQEYRKYEWNVKQGLPDYDKVYTFAVTITPNEYRFYIDGILTGVCKEKEALSDALCYLIINNAAIDTESVFEILEVNYYK